MQQLLKTLGCLILSLFLIKDSNAQFNDTVFYDTLTQASQEGYINTGFGDGKFIYLSGGSFRSGSALPTVTKLDTTGNVIWTAIDRNNYDRFAGYLGQYGRSTCRGTYKSNSRLFTIAQMTGNPEQHPVYEVWCVSDSNGSLLWKRSFKDFPLKIADYSTTEMLLFTSGDAYQYHIISKETGEIMFQKQFDVPVNPVDNGPDMLVDNNHNILISWEDTCRKYRDKKLTQLVWTSTMNDVMIGRQMISKISQDSGKYIFMGLNNTRAVDTLTGNTVWFNKIRVGFISGVQAGTDAIPMDYILKDSLLYITWNARYTGGSSYTLKRGFTLTSINKNNGHIRYNVAHDFTGIPAASTTELDWPMQICMDDNKDIYMTGGYDHGVGNGNWGIMKLNGETGNKFYEATITDDSTRRYEYSVGTFIYYSNGKLYNAGNLEKKNDYGVTKPVFLCFDTSSVFKVRYRLSPSYSIRYPSELSAITPLGLSKMALFKKIGRSVCIELRDIRNKLLWSKTFSSPGKFITPQHFGKLSDTGIVASFIVYQKHAYYDILMGKQDSVVFVKLDTLGKMTFMHSIKCVDSDSLLAGQLYTDRYAITNFIFGNKSGDNFSHKGYMLSSKLSYLSDIGGAEKYDDPVVMKTNFVQHYNGDTMVYYQPPYYINFRLASTTQASTGYKNYGYDLRFIKGFARINSVLKLDSSSFAIMGRDSSGLIKLARVDHRQSNPWVWVYNSSVKGSMYHADTSGTSIFAVSKTTTNKIVLSKISKRTGIAVWSVEKVPLPQTSIVPADLKYDSVNNHFIVGGYVTNSTAGSFKTNYFYTILDSSGNIIRDVVKAGYGLDESKINAVSVLQNGTNIYGGSIGTSEWGAAGFYTSDNFSNSTYQHPVCPHAATSLTSQYFGLTYQWQVDTGRGFADVIDGPQYAGTRTRTITLSNPPSDWYNYRYRCLADGYPTSAYTIYFENRWFGVVDSSWENPSNWSCGSVPDYNTDVIIESGTIKINRDAICRSLKVAQGVKFSVNSGATLTIIH